jgi:membrane protease YdiL (CAAX protease family)
VTIATGILYGLYLVKTKNLIGCIIAHATTNLGLAIYVVYTQKWYFW